MKQNIKKKKSLKTTVIQTKPFIFDKTKDYLAIGSDHAGFLLKEEIKSWLTSLGFHILDVGTNFPERTDYVSFGKKVCQLLQSKKAKIGILCCGSGVGVNIIANRHKGIRALRCQKNDFDLVKLARQHNDINLLTFGAKFIDLENIQKIMEIFFNTEFLNDLAYQKRNDLLDQ